MWNDRDLKFAGIHRKFVYHSSKPDDPNTSAIVASIVPEGKGNTKSFIWPVYSPFIPAAERKLLNLSEVYGVPKYITITQIFRVNGHTMSTHATLSAGYVKGLYFEEQEGQMCWDIKPLELAEWLRNRLRNDPYLMKTINAL